MNLITEKQHLFEDAIKHLKSELIQIRTGRANPALVENLKIDCYGIMTPLNQVANLSAPDPASIVIQPWDKNIIKEIEKSIQTSPLGLNPVNEGNIIRIPITPLTEEKRIEIVKIVSEKVEQAKVSIRNIREDIWKNIKEQKTEGKITEDDLYKYQKELQTIIDDNNERISKIGEEKETDIMNF